MFEIVEEREMLYACICCGCLSLRVVKKVNKNKKCKSTWSNAKASAVAPMINWREVLAGSSCGRRSVTPPTATIATAENNCDFFFGYSVHPG